jgi:hypothetical protein
MAWTFKFMFVTSSGCLSSVITNSILFLPNELQKRENISREKRANHQKIIDNQDNIRAFAVPSEFVTRQEPSGRLIRFDRRVTALIVFPQCGNAFDGSQSGLRFATRIHEIIDQLHKKHPCGWIIDLRGNVGGNMWPMLAGAGPLLGGIDVGFFDSGTSKETWFYRCGVAGVRQQDD